MGGCVEDQQAPSRSAVVSVRASFPLSCQSRALGVGANDDGRRSGLSSRAAGAEDSYRFAALSHEFRNLRKSSRVSLSAASSARAAHSAAFCRQYPIFSCMMVSALEPAALSISPRLGAELGEGSTTSTPEKRIKFQCVGWAKRSVPTRRSACGKDARGPPQDAPLPTLRFFGAPPRNSHDPRLAGWKPKAPPRVLSCRGNEHRVRSMKEELTTILEAMRAAQGELADYLVSADRNAELTIAKLVGILERREVIKAMRLLRAFEGPSGVPQRTLAEAS